jgi:hypothetical protein
MNIIRTLLVIILFASPLFAEKFPAQVKKSITFIYSRDTSNRLTVQGTGFFVYVKTQQDADTATFGYLVTAKSALKRKNGTFFDTLFVRINRKEGYSDTLLIQLKADGAQRYFVHPDSTVDLAVIPAFPDVKRYDVLYLPAGMIGGVDVFTKENITEGSEVFYTGMLQSHMGVFKNIPAVKFGKIVQMSEEKYQWERSFTEFFLIEANSIPGSEGSPVYYYSETAKDSAGVPRLSKISLCGVLAGSYQKDGNDLNLARVIPSYKLNELLNLSGVAGEREKEFARLKQNSKK